MLGARFARKVWSFEPEPENVALLRRSVQLNGFQNVVIHDTAVTDHAGQADLFLSRKSAGRHSLFPHTGVETLRVECNTLDALLPIETIDLLKVDVEGSEPEVLAGARKLITERRIKHVITEWNPKAWENRLQLLHPFKIQTVLRKPFDPKHPKGLLENNVLLEPRDSF